MTDQDVTVIFSSIDANMDGRISYNEFVDWCWTTPCSISTFIDPVKTHDTPEEAMDGLVRVFQGMKEEGVKAREIFNKLDVNGNGKVSMYEFVTGCRSLHIGMGATQKVNEHDYTDKLLGEVFKLMNPGKDSLLSLAEFKRAIG